MSRRWEWAGVTLLGVYAAISVTTGARHAVSPGQSQDLAPVYMAARLWLSGSDPYRARSPEEWQQATGAREVPAAAVDRAYSTPYPPVALLVLAGISSAEWEVAKAWWLAINLVLAAYVPWVIRRLWFSTWTVPASAAFVALWLGGMGLRVGLGNGQHALFWFAAILTMFWLMRAGRPGWAGVPLALSLHKYPLTVLVLPYMAAHRWFRVLAAGAVATAAALIVFAVGLRVESRQVVDSFLRELAWWYGQSGGGRLTGQGMTDFYPVLAALMRERAATIAMSGLLVAATAMACWPTGESRPMPRSIDVAAVVLLMLFATYHRVYDTIVLIVPLCCLAAWWHGAAGWRRSVLGALGGLLALVWYVDPSAVYRRLVPMSLDHLPETGAFVVLDLAYRIVIAAALTMVVVLRYRSAPPMMLAVRSARA